MRRLAAIAILLLAACEPSGELDGGTSSAASTAPSESPAEPLLPPGELAGGPPPGVLLAGVVNLVPPSGAQVIDACETIIAADYTNPPKMICLVFAEDAASANLSPALRDAMAAAGWTLVRSQGTEHYFERPTPGRDCADMAVVSDVADRKAKLAAKITPAPDGAWRAYSIPATIHEACGADRMKP